MIPFAIKVLWFVLSITGMITCWVVLVRFGMAVKWMTGPLVYCVAATLLNGAFLLGMIWRMDPFAMPPAFCHAQIYIISLGSFLLTGCCAVCSVVTTRIVTEYSKGRTQMPSEFCRWRHIYLLPLIIFPCVASAVQITLSVRYDAIKPSDDLHCDATSPISFRFLGYAGVPHLLTIPCLYYSLISIIRFVRTKRHIIRSLPDGTTTTTVFPTNYRTSMTDGFHDNRPVDGRSLSGTAPAPAAVSRVARMTVVKSEDRRGPTTPLTRLPFLPTAAPLTEPHAMETMRILGGNDLKEDDDHGSSVASPCKVSDSEETETPLSTGHTLSPRHSSDPSSDYHQHSNSIHEEDRNTSASSIVTTSSLSWARPNALDVGHDHIEIQSPQYCRTMNEEYWGPRRAPSSHAHGRLWPSPTVDDRTCVGEDREDGEGLDAYSRPQRKTRFDVMGSKFLLPHLELSFLDVDCVRRSCPVTSQTA
ncbi:hypothetical protein BDV98DRAFT_205686 [Pterulicium gracile]|uniref:Uncharacterized protein n=1 Tax=Pterulicium gracile TaxID=1884261 RepID=A0A5C3QBR8_9AGAR|nr:hypothetical protein BDV98DRAFT_205686 [Pterula gracilis]